MLAYSTGEYFYFIDFKSEHSRKPNQSLHLICIHIYICFFLQTYGALFCETSAKDGSNIVEAVLHLAR